MSENPMESENLGVGVEELDRQHRILLDLTHEMVRAAEGHREGTVVEALFSGMLAYAAEHFRTEEEMMRQAGFPDLEKHQAHHGVLLTKARDFHERFRQGNVDAAGFGLFFVGWVVLHIRNEDRQYTDCLHSAGIQ